MPNHDEIYAGEAGMYEQLVAREDRDHQIERTIRSLLPELAEVDAADIGAGTGRLTCMLAPHVRSVVAIDRAPAMLEVAKQRLEEAGMTNWTVRVGEHRQLPAADASVDLVTAGWTICYEASSNHPDWKLRLEAILREARRITRPGGLMIIFETFGTGCEQPSPPDFLTAYYRELEHAYGFDHRWIRTDMEFESAEEAARLCRFFFGDELADAVKAKGSPIVPECTGVWWKRL
ncbi:class I SAM-dependent methyltransferase [Paenibacillus methanolicus]|uniref:Methyltransferase family protein n=1 Tax=Paenibacillus methanolicus TaxID=582686 RepID=A0A5S5CEF3_9BACL|nr:class I SAM-dependent methyltransferase [Paenibacillus methanolicus]TYP77519.1 methyltransferase family protein [Paenibacillus methanolicus]